MQPNVRYCTIDNNEDLILKFIMEVIIDPRRKIHYWSKITDQTPILKMGYVAQHLASLITGMKGSKSGARGIDIIDGTEVKACTRVDQVDKCEGCGTNVFRSQQHCDECGESENIRRNNDSKWLFTITNEDELNELINTERILLIISDYPDFENKNYENVRYQAFEIHPKLGRCVKFKELVNNYYEKYYLKKIGSNKKPSPMNFWPYSFQFYLCNPVKIFSCIIENIDCDESRNISIEHYIKPNEDRTQLKPEDMPIDLITLKEIKNIIRVSDYETLTKKNLINSNISISQKELLSRMSTKNVISNYFKDLDSEIRLILEIRSS